MDAGAHEDLSAPLRHCKLCGQDKPWTENHWKRGSGGRGWRPYCRPCDLARVKPYGDRRKADKKAGRAPTPPVVRALERVPLPAKPAKPSLRTILEAEAEQNYERLAKKLVKTALGEGKDAAAALKLVFSYILGTPREASEDQGPTEFWHALLADARQLHAGTGTDVGTATADLGADPDSDG